MEYLFDILLYLLVFIFSSLLVYKGLKLRQKGRGGRLLIMLGILMPSIMAGIRYNVGMDFPSYLGMYNNAVAGRQLYYRSIEPASTLIITLSAYLRSSSLMFFSFSLITNTCFFLAFRRLFKDSYQQTSIAFFLYLCILYSTTLNAVRSGAAIALLFLSFSYFIKQDTKKPVLKSLALLIISFLFHRSVLIALIFLPAFWLAKKHSGRKILVDKTTMWLAYTMVAIMLPAIYALARSFLPLGNYSRYLVGLGSDFSIPLVNIAMSIPIVLASTRLLKGTKTDQDKQFREILYCAAFYIPLSIVVGWLTYVEGLSRVSFIIEPLIICVMSYLIMFAKKAGVFWNMITVAIIIVTGMMFVRNLNWSGALPYRTIFHEDMTYVSKN